MRVLDKSPPKWAACLAVLFGVLMVGSPAFGLTVTVTDPDESGITIQGYDIKKLEIDDSSSTYLSIEFQTYDTLIPHDSANQLRYQFFLDVHGFDQNTGVTDPVAETLAWDFRIYWFGDPAGGSTYDNQIFLYGQDYGVMWTSGSTPPIGDTLTLLVPWTEFKQAGTGTLAFPALTIYPPGISFWGGVDNGQGQPDDRVPDEGYIVVPEPLTMLGVFTGIAGLGGYIRRRKLA